VKLRKNALVVAASIACVAAASIPVGAAAAPALRWSCGPYTLLGYYEAPVPVGYTATNGTAYIDSNRQVVVVGSVTYVRVSTTVLDVTSSTAVAGWTDVVLKNGNPRIDIQYTNTANTLRIRDFFQIGNTNGWLGLHYTVCVPAT
jgi:hypothetical protein